MSKSVLISIQPYWVFLIIAEKMGWNIGKEKTVEIRKNYPKDETWDKTTKIYCSRDKKSFARIPKEYQHLMERLLGEVIGEFVCNEIKDGYLTISDYITNVNIGHNETCLSVDDISEYLGMKYVETKGRHKFYGWHISDLKIYDKPRELSEFIVEGDCSCENCRKCKWIDRGNGYNVEDDCLLPYTNSFGKAIKPLFRPPQSWCYVEEV